MMGMFDIVRIQFPIPWPEVQDVIWQSKSTPAQYLDSYEIREDGSLWHEAYDERVEKTDKAPMGCWIHQENQRWERELLDGEIECDEYIEHNGRPGGLCYSCRFWFRKGVIADVIFERRDTAEAAETAGGD